MSTPVIHTNKLRVGSSNAYTGITVGTSPVYRVKIGSDIKYDRKDYDFSVAGGRIYIPVGGGNMYSSIAAKVTSTYTGYNDSDTKVTNGSASWAANQTWWSSNAQSTSQKTGSITVTQDNSNLSGTIYWTQYADSYETLTAITSITLTLNTPSTISAGGGSVNSTTYSVKAYGYTYRHWASGADTNQTNGNWNVTPDNIEWTGVTAYSKGTSASTQTYAGTLYANATYSGKSSNAHTTVYQDANSAGSPSWTSITATAGEYPEDLSASGGTASTMSSSNITVTAAGYVPYTSGSKAPTSTTVSSSQVTVSAGTAVVASSKGTSASTRTYVDTLYLKAQWNGMNSNQMSVRIYQKENKIESYSWSTLAFSLGTPSTIPAGGGSVSSTTYSDVHLEGTATYSSYSTKPATSAVTITNTKWGSSSSPSGPVTWDSAVSADSKGTSASTQTVAGYLWLKATGGTKTGTSYVAVTQEANRKDSSPTYTGITATLSTPAQIAASGGTVSTASYTAKQTGYYGYTSGDKEKMTGSTNISSYYLTADTITSVTAKSKGTTITGVTTAGTLVMLITYESKGWSASASATVTQAANSVVSSAVTTETGKTLISSTSYTSNYEMSVSPTSKSFTSGSGSTNITVTARHDATTEYVYNNRERSVTALTYTSGEVDDNHKGAWRYWQTTETDTQTRIPDTPRYINPCSWITVTTGSSTWKISVTAQENNAPARDGTITLINTPNYTATFSVSQAAGKVVLPNEIALDTNDWEYMNGDTNQFVVTVYTTGGSGSYTWKTQSYNGDYNSSYFTVSPTMGSNGRSVTITAKKRKNGDTLDIIFHHYNDSSKTATLTVWFIE